MEGSLFEDSGSEDISAKERALIDDESSTLEKRPIRPTAWLDFLFIEGVTFSGYGYVKKQLREGADVNLKSYRNGETPLHMACQNGNYRIVELLIENGAQVNDVTGSFEDYYRCGYTPLHMACTAYSSDCVDIVKLLIEKGADVHRKCAEGRAPLHYACGLFEGKFEVTKLLLEHGADVNAKDNKGETPLHRMWDPDYLEMAKLLIENGADVRATSHRGDTPLHCVPSSNLARLLIENGADVNAKDSNGMTPLHRSCEIREQYDLEIVQCLVENGADLNAKDKNGKTPLHIASEYACLDSMQLLLNRGADVYAKTAEGKTPLDAASKRNCPDVVLYLLRQHPGVFLSV